jgi:hypothetical protein
MPRWTQICFFWLLLLRVSHLFITVVMRQLRSEFKFPAKIEMAFSQMLHTGYIEVIIQGKCRRNTETTFDIK